jgi:glycine/D-amino acid oxidase-like deaminating enzyme
MPHAPSLYAATADPTLAFPALIESARADVAIVGGGYTGLSAALHLAEAGADVAVLEGERVGWGASGRNGGQLHSGQRRDQDWLEDHLGIDDALKLWRLAEEAKALTKGLIARHAIACDWRDGLIETVHKRRLVPGEMAYVERLQSRYGYETEWLGRDRLAAAIGTDVYFGGRRDMGAGHLDPLKFAQGLARAAAKAGARIFEGTRAVRVSGSAATGFAVDVAAPSPFASTLASGSPRGEALSHRGRGGDSSGEGGTAASARDPSDDMAPIPSPRRGEGQGEGVPDPTGNGRAPSPFASMLASGSPRGEALSPPGRGGDSSGSAGSVGATIQVRADIVILAGNGYLDDIDEAVEARAMPIDNYILATMPIGAGEPRGLIAGGEAVSDTRFVVYYFRPSADGRLIFGGGETYSRRPPADVAAFVRRHLLRIYPQLAGTRIDYAWGGTLAITLPRLPFIRRVRPGVYAAAGYSGQGVALAPFAGKVLADAIRGDPARLDTFAAFKVPPFPGGKLLRKPALAAGMLWYALRDRL